MNHIKWLAESIVSVKKSGFGSVSLTINIKDGKEDIIQKTVVLTDKVKDGYTSNTTSSVIYKIKRQDI